MGTGLGAGITSPLILATAACFSKANTKCYPYKADFSTQKQESLLVGMWGWFLQQHDTELDKPFILDYLYIFRFAQTADSAIN